MGLQVIAVDMDPNAIGFQEEGVICEVISTIDTEAVLAAAKKHNIDGIVTICTDLPMRTVARVAKELGLPGISEESQKHIFDKFYQADSSHKQEGNGLGLALVKKILHLCGGEVSAENVPEGGCRFTVRMKQNAAIGSL